MIPTPDGHFQSVTLKKTSAGTFQQTGAGAGHYVPGTATVEQIRASVQPLSQNELEQYNIGGKVVGAVLIITDASIQGPREGSATEQELPGDRIVFDGDEFEVVRVDRYKMGQLDHVEAVAIRVRDE